MKALDLTDTSRHLDWHGRPRCGASAEGALLVDHDRHADCRACLKAMAPVNELITDLPSIFPAYRGEWAAAGHLSAWEALRAALDGTGEPFEIAIDTEAGVGTLAVSRKVVDFTLRVERPSAFAEGTRLGLTGDALYLFIDSIILWYEPRAGFICDDTNRPVGAETGGRLHPALFEDAMGALAEVERALFAKERRDKERVDQFYARVAADIRARFGEIAGFNREQAGRWLARLDNAEY